MENNSTTDIFNKMVKSVGDNYEPLVSTQLLPRNFA